MGRKKAPEETMNQILDVSLRLFLEKGYEHTTVQDIVDHMDGLSRGAIYHHFKSKEDIVDAVTKRMFEESGIFDPSAGDHDHSCTALDKMKRIMRDSLTLHVDQKIFAETAPILKNPKFLAKQLEDCIDYLAPRIQQLIEEGNLDGSMSCEDPELAAEMIAVLLNIWCIPAVLPVTKEKLMKKFALLQAQTNALGVPFLDDSVKEACLKFAEVFAD